MKVRVKTLKEFKKTPGVAILRSRIIKAGVRCWMTPEMMDYCGKEIEVELRESHPGRGGLKYRCEEVGKSLTWQEWMFEEIKMNRNGANNA